MIPLSAFVLTKESVKPERYAGKAGFVVSVNRIDYPYVEYGLCFSSARSSARPQAWFSEKELEWNSITKKPVFTNMPVFKS